MSNVLSAIVEHKKMEVAERKKQRPLYSFQSELTPSSRSLKNALIQNKAAFILECKKASPSKGLIREYFNLAEILSQYSDYASAISVLTDQRYFQGDFAYLQQASAQVSVPILCKDFFIEPYQVYEALSYGADAILLMLSVLNDEQYQQLATLAAELNLDVLTEVHDEEEMTRAIKLEAKIIGINNRNLKDLSIDLATTERLAKRAPKDCVLISESGISTHADVCRLRPLVNGFLVGSSIMAQTDIRSQCKALIYGHAKVCGITRVSDAQTIDRLGAIYAGFIFYQKSPRAISLDRAKSISSQVALRFVGVFVNAPIEQVIDYTAQLKLFAVQLHGDESSQYIAKLKQALANTANHKVQIWKAVAVSDALDIPVNNHIDFYLLDTQSAQRGGSGKTFDWQLLDSHAKDQLIIAGGINPTNVLAASRVGAFAIDLNSGVETSPGIKCVDKLTQAFNQLRV